MLTTSFPRFAVDFPGRPVYELSKTLLASGQIQEVHVVAPHTPGAPTRETLDGIEVHRFRYAWPECLQTVAYGQGIVQNLRSSLSAKLLLLPFLVAFAACGARVARRCDLIHAHWILGGLVGSPVAALSRRPMIMSVRGSALRSFPAALSRHALRRSRALISPHPELTDILCSLGATEIDEIPNPIDFEKFSRPADPQVLAREFPELGGHPLVTYVGRLYDFKDPLTFVRAIPAVARHRPDARFILIGDGPLLPQVRAEATELGIAERLVLTGARPDPEHFLSASSAFVALSPTENIWSNTLVEAMTAGVPCVVTTSGTSARTLAPSASARLIAPRDPEALATAILDILENPEAAQKTAQNAHSLLQEKGFALKLIAEKTIAVYRRAIAPSLTKKGARS